MKAWQEQAENDGRLLAAVHRNEDWARKFAAIPWGAWICALEEHVTDCQRPGCLMCAEWARQVAIAKSRRARAWMATLCVLVVVMGLVAIVWRLAGK